MSPEEEERTRDELVAALEQRITEVHEYVDAHVGQSWGTADPQWPHGTPVFPFREIHTLSRQSIDPAHSVTFVIDYDEYIAKLHNAQLRVRFYNVRSNVSAAAGVAAPGGSATSQGGGGVTQSSTAGGGETVSSVGGGGGSLTSTAGGGAIGGDVTSQNFNSGQPNPVSTQAESGADPHTHSMNNHVHMIFGHRLTLAGPDVNMQLWQPDGMGTLVLTDHEHVVTAVAHQHSVTTTSHQHSITLSPHTHDVTLPSHSHTITLTYGIFEQPYSNPGLRISINGTDRTAALGGPWNTPPPELDITQWLRETSGEPLRGDNIISFTVTASLLDVEAILKSIALPSNLLVAGLP